MSALSRLQEKIEQLKSNYEAMRRESDEMRAKIDGVSGNEHEMQKTINAIRYELEEKDREIEEIVTKVESLLA